MKKLFIAAMTSILVFTGCSKNEEREDNKQITLKASSITVRAHGTSGSEQIQLKVGSTTVATWTLTTSYANYSASTSATGTVQVQFTNDASGRDVQVDYVSYNGTTYQAESQSVNTGTWNGSSCGGSNSEWLHCNGYIQFPGISNGTPVAAINLSGIRQTIDGFGASTAWHGQISDAEANAGFSNGTNQIGLSILRVRIDPNNNNTDEIANSSKARSRGAIVLATPWTPPASMKTTNNTVGGELKTTEYANYANFLKNAANSLSASVVSVQNEPNITVTYESCTWNSTQLLNWCKNNASSVGKPIMMPEAYNFATSLSDPTLNDATAVTKITYIGGHLYGASPFYYTLALNKGKKVWMTEHYYDADDISTCMSMAKEINDCMCNNMSAYIWWYLRQPGCNLMNTGGSLKKKGYIMAQYSKFIRPGYQRVDAPYNPTGNVFLSAYKGSKVVIVAVNQSNSSATLSFNYQNGTVTSVTKYTTSGSKNLQNDGAISVSGNSFTTTLDAQSVTTFVSN